MAEPLIRDVAAPRPAAKAEVDVMHRVRIGLTGLCAVFVLVLLAAAIFGLTPAEKGVRPPPADSTTANATAETPKDPLAELGLTPGGSASDEAAPAPAPPPPSPAQTP